MMPMDPAKAVSVVRPFLVNRFRRDRPKAVHTDMEGRLVLTFFCSSASWMRSPTSSSALRGRVSPVISPSSTRMMRLEYRSANSGL